MDGMNNLYQVHKARQRVDNDRTESGQRILRELIGLAYFQDGGGEKRIQNFNAEKVMENVHSKEGKVDADNIKICLRKI